MGRMLNALRLIEAKFAVAAGEPKAYGNACKRSSLKVGATAAPPAETFAPAIVQSASWGSSEVGFAGGGPAVVATTETAPPTAVDGQGTRADGWGREPIGRHNPALQLDRRYEKVAAAILSQLPPGQSAAIVFTSPGSSEGKTGVVVSLGAVLGERIAHGVLLVDANSRSPALTRLLGADGSLGLADVLRGDLYLGCAIRPTAMPGVSLLPAGRFDVSEGEPLDVRRLPEVLGECRAEYEMVLVDAGPLCYPEVPRLARHGDGTYLVVRLGVTTRREVARAVALVKRYGSRVLGCVLAEG